MKSDGRLRRKKGTEGPHTGLYGEQRGVTPIISTVLLLAIILAIVSGVLAWSIPLVQKLSLNAQYRNAYNQLSLIDTSIEDIVVEGGDPMAGGSSRTLPLTVGSGAILFATNDETWTLSYPNPSFSQRMNVLIYSKEDALTGRTVLDIDISVWDDTAATPGMYPVEKVYVSAERIREKENVFPKSKVPDPDNGLSMSFFVPTFPDGTESINDTHISIYMNETDTVPMAEVWVFGSETISHILYSNYGTFETTFTNHAIISNYPHPEKKKIVSSPPLMIKEDSATFYFLSMEAVGATFIQTGNYEAFIQSRGTEVILREDVGSMRIHIKGDNSKAWYEYLQGLSTDFTVQSNSLVYSPPRSFDMKIAESLVTVDISHSGS